MSVTRTSTTSTTAIGCLINLLLIAGIAFLIEQRLGANFDAALRPWAAIVAAVLFTLSLGAGWTLVASGRSGGSRSAILDRAARGEVPAGDGIVLASGTVRPAAGALVSPFGGVNCVAYLYRIWDEPARGAHGERRREEPHYWGFASRPFVVETPSRAIRVMAVPQLLDPPRRCTTPEELQQARRWVRETRFDTKAPGVLGAVGTVFGIVDTLLNDDDGEARGDWSIGEHAADPGSLRIEEIAVPVGAAVSVVGPWSAERHAIVPGVDGVASRGVKLATGPADSVLQLHADALPPGRLTAFVFMLVLAALGIAVLWAAENLPRLLNAT